MKLEGKAVLKYKICAAGMTKRREERSLAVAVFVCVVFLLFGEDIAVMRREVRENRPLTLP